MRQQTHVSKVLWFEGLGFLMIIALSWIGELSDLPRLVGANQYVPNWRESALETLFVLLVVFPVMLLTKQLVSRLYHLEGFLRVCAWCKKLEHNGNWIPLEEFFQDKFHTETSHGICFACVENEKGKVKKYDA